MKKICDQKMYIPCILLVNNLMIKQLDLYLMTYHQQTNQSQHTNKKIKLIQEVDSPEVSNLNHGVMKKGKEIKCSFLQKKRLEKKIHSSNPSCQLMDCVIKWVIDPSMLLEFFSFVSKCLYCNREKTAEMSSLERTGSASATPQL